MRLAGIFIYPVKSLRGCAVTAAAVDSLGLAGDRRFMLVDEDGRFLTARTVPRMTAIAVAVDSENLTLSTPGFGAISGRRTAEPEARLRTVSVWKSEGLLAEDCGSASSDWLSAVLSLQCRLVRCGGRFSRPASTQVGGGAPEHLSFADLAPFLVTTESSLNDLNDRLASAGEEQLPMDRFRPNLVVADAPAFGEDHWRRFRVGEITFRYAGPCGRCVVTTMDQSTGARHVEPLRTLATYRRDPHDPGNVIFGAYVSHETKQGTLRVGDPVRVL
jgi:uncharacterized protein YcbX